MTTNPEKTVSFLKLAMHHANYYSFGNILLQDGAAFIARKGDEMSMPFIVVYLPIDHEKVKHRQKFHVKHLVAAQPGEQVLWATQEKPLGSGG